jgi:hypothetical protein
LTATRSSASDRDVALARGVLVLFALILPFEAPLFRVWFLQITSVELLLYATVGAWLTAVSVDVARSRSFARWAAFRSRLMNAVRAEPLAVGAALWALVLVASALAAPSYRGAALKFVLRSLSGVLLFFAVRSLARSPETARRAILGLLAGAILSATTALLDWYAPNAAVWTIFRASGFDAFGLDRASGVFAYPTIGAMYWEAAIPLAIVVPLLREPPRRMWLAVAVSASVPLVWALVASGTRSGLAGAAVACAGLVAFGPARPRQKTETPRAPMRRAAVAVLVVLALTSALTIGGTSLVGQRLRWWQDRDWFRADYDVGACPTTLHIRESFTLPVHLRNTGTLRWQRSGARPFRLAYHWDPLERDATLGDFEGRRTELPVDVPPGGAVDVVASARAPARPGTYRLRWDLVQEHVTWFSERGNAMPAQSVVVEEQPEGAPPPEISAAESLPVPPAPQPPPSRPALWRAALALWRERPLLGVGPDNFRRRYLDVIGLDPTGQPYSDTRIHANNFYLETLADLGLVGLAVLAWVMIGLFRSLRALSRADRLAGLGCGIAAGAFFVHGCLDYFLEFTPLYGLFWTLLGVTAAQAEGLPNGARRDNRA